MERFINWKSAEKSYTVIALFLYTEALLRLLITGGAASQNVKLNSDGSLIVLTFSGIYFITLILIVLRWRKVFKLISENKLILVLLFFPVFSYFWSDFPALTLRRSIALFGTSLFGLYFASRYRLKEQVNILGWVYGLVSIMSLSFIILIPKLGVSHGILAGAWRGIYTHKNGLAMQMVLSIIIFLLLALDRPKHRRLMLAFAGLSFFLLIPARSGTGLVTSVFLISLIPIVQITRHRKALVPTLFGLLTISLVTYSYLVPNFNYFLSSIGENSTLSGRADFWPLVITKILERPWLGYGHEAFWRGLYGGSADIYWAGMEPSHAHNGILQLALNLGFIGVFIFLIVFWKTLIKSITQIYLSKSATSLWPLLFLSFVAMTNIAESGLMKYNDITMVLFVSVATSALVHDSTNENNLTHESEDDKGC